MSGWSSAEIAESYATATSRSVRPLLVDVLRVAHAGPGDRVLDVGCGPGELAELLHERHAQMVGLDASPAMLKLALRHAPGGSWVLGEAEALPFRSASFAQVVSNLGILHAADPARALADAARVLRSEGTLVWSGWDASGQDRIAPLQAGMSLVEGAAESPPFHAVRLTLERARELTSSVPSLRDVQARVFRWSLPFADFEEYWTSQVNGTVVQGGKVRALATDQADRVREGARAALERFRVDPSGYRIPTAAWIVRARRA